VYAVIEALGHQYRVKKGDVVTIDRCDGNEGDKITFDKVLAVGGASPVIGAPVVKGASVTAVVKAHTRNDKIIVFKYKRRKNYKVTRGHKQKMTTVEITDIKA
jgi:large subunit ribosomal protein L21